MVNYCISNPPAPSSGRLYKSKPHLITIFLICSFVSFPHHQPPLHKRGHINPVNTPRLSPSLKLSNFIKHSNSLYPTLLLSTWVRPQLSTLNLAFRQCSPRLCSLLASWITSIILATIHLPAQTLLLRRLKCGPSN